MDTPSNELSENLAGQLSSWEYQSGYISYLNSLHNMSANGSNALAESQALNRYFSDLYVPLPLTNEILKCLTEEDVVVILTGHAGDGKSTVSLDIFKQLKKHPIAQPLSVKLKELESVDIESRHVSIIKDMSELSSKTHLEYLDNAFQKPGSWLIVSNTGPLLNSLSEFSNQNNESEILEKLDIPYQRGRIDEHELKGDHLSKKLIIINMTQLNNVDQGAKVLERMLNHPGWEECEECGIKDTCPIYNNRNALLESSNIIERVRWIYQRLTAYEKRLTLRQIVAHLSLSLTSGQNCEETKNSDKGLADILFSETFFGYKNGKSWENSSTLGAIKLIQRLEFGSPISVRFERNMTAQDSSHWVLLPKALETVEQSWRKKSRSAKEGVNIRFALRRMAYLYGQRDSSTNESDWSSFLDRFLQAPKLRQFDNWQNNQALDLPRIKQRKFKKEILQVLLEVYSGFSAGQFKGTNSKLFLTLKRPDRSVVQATQIVVASLSNEDFSIKYDKARCLPFLDYKSGEAKLMLTLPLLDYIHARSNGNLGNQLAPLHLTQLEWFRSDLLRLEKNDQEGDEIILLRAGIDGVVNTHRYYLEDNKLESAN